MTTMSPVRRMGVAVVFLLTPACQADRPILLGAAAAADFLNGTRLALEEGIQEGSLPAFDTILIGEGSNRSAPALRVAEALVARPGLVAVIGHANSTASLATSQVYNEHRVVQIAPTSTAELYSVAGPFSFRMVPPDGVQGEFLAQLLRDSVPYGTPLALLYVSDDYGRGLRAEVLERLDPDAHPVVVDIPHTEGDVQELDVTHHLLSLRDSDPGVILWLGRVPALNVLLPGIRETLGEVVIYGGDAIMSAALMTDRIPEWVGVRYLDFVDLDGTPELRDFQRRYRERFGKEASGSEALSYDAAGVLLASLRSGAGSGDDVRRYLESLGRDRPPFPGITGPLQFSENGDVDRQYVLKTVAPLDTR